MDRNLKRSGVTHKAHRQMLFQEATPDTVNYMLLGFAVLLGLPLLYVISFITRQRNLEKDIQLIESLKDEEK